jgi:pentapeptide MXKDX repeat protein
LNPGSAHNPHVLHVRSGCSALAVSKLAATITPLSSMRFFTCTTVQPTLNKGNTMKKLMAVMMFSAAMMGFAGVTQAADSMSKDTMGKMSHDCMKKDSMGKDQMGKDCMSKDKMSKDQMKKDSMSKDAMSKDAMKKDAMSQ